MQSMVVGEIRPMFKDIAPKANARGVKRARKLRRKMTLPEVLLWRIFRQRPHGLKIRRQHETGRYVLDFYCSDARLAIEIDGKSHDQIDRSEHDRKRDEWAAGHGIDTLRVPASEVLANVDRAAEAIVDYIRARLPHHHPAAPGGPPPRDQLGED
jgi:very-short-patch-repair endonuclease